jgi:hypothetical protein
VRCAQRREQDSPAETNLGELEHRALSELARGHHDDILRVLDGGNHAGSEQDLNETQNAEEKENEHGFQRSKGRASCRRCPGRICLIVLCFYLLPGLSQVDDVHTIGAAAPDVTVRLRIGVLYKKEWGP